MEQLTFSAVTVLIILLPGFFTARIVESLTTRPSETELDKVIEALFYSFLIYFICVAFLGINPLIVHVQRARSSAILEVDAAALRTFIIYAFVLAASLALAISYSTTNDVLTRFLRFLTITRRTSRTSIWSDVFHDINEFVVVEFTDGRRIRGWPRLFSDTPKEGKLVPRKSRLDSRRRERGGNQRRRNINREESTNSKRFVYRTRHLDERV